MTKRIEETLPVQDFIRVAKTYCTLIEERNERSEIDVLQLSYQSLPQLCMLAMNLPDIQRSKYYKGEISHPIWNRIFKSLQLKFTSAHDEYVYTDPYEKIAKPLSASLSDDLADIYRDIVPGLKDWLNSDATSRRGIIWGWKWGYENHWGDHATSAFRAIHFLLFSQIVDNDGDYVGLRKIIWDLDSNHE